MLKNQVYETANAPGTNATINLLGAPSNRQSFVQAFGNGARCYYAIDDGSKSEIGIGTITSGSPNTLSRDTVLWTSTGGTSRLNFTGAVGVYNTIPAERAIYYDADNRFVSSGAILTTLLNFDTSSYITFMSGNPLYNFDYNDFMRYNRAGDYLEICINGARRLMVNPDGTLNVQNNMTCNGLTAVTATVGGAAQVGSLRATGNRVISQGAQPSMTLYNTAGHARGFHLDSNGTAYWSQQDGNGNPVRAMWTISAAGDLSVPAFSADSIMSRGGVSVMNDWSFGIYASGDGAHRFMSMAANWGFDWNTANGDLNWIGNGVSRFSITGSGSLVLQGTAFIQGGAVVNGQVYANGLYVGAAGSDFGSFVSGGARVSQYAGGYGWQWNTTNGLLSYVAQSSEKVRIRPDGFVSFFRGVGCRTEHDGITDGNYYNFYWENSNGTFHAYINNTYIGALAMTSDPRWKHHISELTEEEADAIDVIEPVKYRWQDKGLWKDNGKFQWGFLSTNVSHIPGAVSGDPDGEQPQSVIDRPILALTVAALKAERKKTEALTREIALIKKFIGME